MNPQGFKAGVDEYISPGETDIDGTVYPTERWTRVNTLCLLDEDEGEDASHAALHIYHVFADDEQIHLIRLVVEDDTGHDAWVDITPTGLEHVASWLFKQATELRPAERR